MNKNQIEPNLNHIKYFISAAQYKSLAKAAQIHGVSQSAISLGIQKLEDALEKKLLIHLKNRFKLTNEGELLFQKAPLIFNTIESIKSEMDDLENELSGHLKIATSMGIAQSFLPSPLGKLSQSSNKLKFQISIGDVKYIVDQVANNFSEIGLLMDDGYSCSALNKRIISQGHFICISKFNSKEPKKKMTIENFIATHEAPGANELTRLLNKENNIKIKTPHLVESWEVITSLTQAGIGIGMIPDFMFNKNQTDLCIHPFSEITKILKYEIILIHKGEHQLSEKAKCFLNLFS